jgi:septal ring-binding cell division protein DamX
MKKDLSGSLLAIAALLAVGLGCGSLKDLGSQTANSTANTTSSANTASTNSTANSATSTNSTDTTKSTDSGIVSPTDKPDYTFTAEEIYKEYKADKTASVDDKYLDKTVSVKGRFKDFDTSKKDTSGGYTARLSAGGTFDWVDCSVDEGNKDEFTKLQKDQMVTFIGLGEQFWIGGPRFKHCRVVAQ